MESKIKTIKINPELFKNVNTKTRKNKESSKILDIRPIVSPNKVRNLLLNRIKEHKNAEIKEFNQHNPVKPNNTTLQPPIQQSMSEFDNANNYLSELSNKYKNHLKNKNCRINARRYC